MRISILMSAEIERQLEAGGVSLCGLGDTALRILQFIHVPGRFARAEERRVLLLFSLPPLRSWCGVRRIILIVLHLLVIAGLLFIVSVGFAIALVVADRTLSSSTRYAGSASIAVSAGAAAGHWAVDTFRSEVFPQGARCGFG